MMTGNKSVKRFGSVLSVNYVSVLLAVFVFVAGMMVNGVGLAAEVRRVPSKNLVEQGFLALTLDAEGAEDFRYTGMENQQHIYRGKIKPGAKVKLVMQATLAKQSSLPLTGRTCTARMEVIAKKGGEVIKKQSFKSENKSNVFVNYTVPEGVDTVEVNETFVLNNQSKEEKYNEKCTTKNKLILSVTGDPAIAAKTGSKTENGDKKTDKSADNNSGTDSDKNAAGSDADKKNNTGTSKTEPGEAKESKGSGKGMLAGAAAAVAAIGGGGYFFMKKRKEDQAVNEEIARKEKLRRQAIQRQQELQQQNLQRRQEEINQHNRMLEEERLREQEQARQHEIQRGQEQQGLMQEQNAMQQPGAAGAAGVMGGVQQNAAENLQQDMSDEAPRFCQNCGSPLKPGTRFCENCGAKV